MDEAAVGRAVDGLAQDSLFTLSTAGQELFHSNFLAWLVQRYPDARDPVWELFEMSVPPPSGPDAPLITVHREHRHVDLIVETGMNGHRLVLENKLHALPSNEQLRRYGQDKAIVPNSAGCRCVLLSLLPPVGEVETGWRYVPYEDYVGAIRRCADQVPAGFDRDLVFQYCNLLDRLIRLTETVDPERHSSDPLLMSWPLRDRMRHVRVLSLVEKMRATRVATATARLTGLPADEFQVGLSNTAGIVQHYQPGPSGRTFGWQLQGDQFRLLVITGPRDPKPRTAREQLVAEQYSDYFNFERPDVDAGVLGPDRARKPWLGYEPNFVYQYRPLGPTTSFEQTVQLCATYSAWARDYAVRSRTIGR